MSTPGVLRLMTDEYWPINLRVEAPPLDSPGFAFFFAEGEKRRREEKHVKSRKETKVVQIKTTNTCRHSV